jgi:beta-lactamase regulating signal transducer with metallopeptidase domain
MLWWALQDLVITALMAAVLWAVCRLGRVGPVARHAMWVVILVKMLTPPLVTWPWSVPEISYASASSSTDHASQVVVASSPTWKFTDSHSVDPPIALSKTEMRPRDASAARITTPTIVSPRPGVFPSLRPSRGQVILLMQLAWACGSVGFISLQGIRIVRMLRRRRGARPADAALRRCVEDLARRWNIGPPCVRMLEGIGSPLVWALGRAELWWPVELSGGLSQEAVSCLVLHELAHIKRRDHWVGRLELLAGCVWWWNPLYWYVCHQLRENAELACDGWVVGTRPAARRAYGEALLAVCECLSGRPAPLPSLGIGTGGRQFLERRLTMILRERITLRMSGMGLLIVGLLAAMSLPAFSQRAGAPPGTGVGAGVGGSQSAGFGSFFDAGAASSSLPPDAQQVLDRLDRDQVQARLEAEAKISQSTQQAIQTLKALQDRYAASGQLDEAVAIRDRIRELERSSPAARQAQSPPANLTEYRDRVGQSFLFEIVGANDGVVWGTDVYTDDSVLAAAAVHAGVVQPGERRLVRVTILPGRESYEGSTRNGVTSSSYATWQGSYRIEPAGPRRSADNQGALPEPGDLVSYRDHAGMTFDFRVTGSTSSTIWGKGIYTDDSPLATVAVHAGLLKDGETGIVRVTILPGQYHYDGSTEHGVTSLSYGPFAGSYKVEAPGSSTTVAEPAPATIHSLAELRGRYGESFLIEVTGSTQGTVWGTDVYTDDSSLAAAAVHAGILRDGERGTVKVTILPGRGWYAPSARNGVVSQPWQTWQGSFRVERAPRMY